ncbi:MarR family winged helix-turn-helix transcriptional regulator [Leifsonia sp. RAF41]|uniref:MarR family winged helix-turn-helix transcriptional regulator n=1 Tax=Leifsonia sp. RAF41 TaxID=3233056 RepID=UPI003F960F7A
MFISLVRAETAAWRSAEAALRQAGQILPGMFDLLREISNNEPCRVQDLATTMLITVGGASQAVDRAVRDGYAERRPHPTDRRSQTIVLSPAGRLALQEAEPVLAAAVREAVAFYTPGSASRSAEATR